MPKQNQYFIPKENYKKFEEVRENEIPSFEEFMKTYEVDEKTVESYEEEIRSYGDIRVNRSYGPGNGRLIDEEEADKLSRYMSRYLASKGINMAFGPLSISVGEGLKAVSGEENMFQKIIDNPFTPGIAKKSSGYESEEKSEFMKWLGDLGKDLSGDLEAIEMGTKGLASDIASGVDSEIAKKFWSIINKSLGAYGMWKDVEVGLEITKHFSHRSEGTSYDSDCKVCKS